VLAQEEKAMLERKNGAELSAVEPVIVCPHCKKEIRLTESLAAPLVETTRRQYEEKLADKIPRSPGAKTKCASKKKRLPNRENCRRPDLARNSEGTRENCGGRRR
jgi:hypothetical protein